MLPVEANSINVQPVDYVAVNWNVIHLLVTVEGRTSWNVLGNSKVRTGNPNLRVENKRTVWKGQNFPDPVPRARIINVVRNVKVTTAVSAGRVSFQPILKREKVVTVFKDDLERRMVIIVKAVIFIMYPVRKSEVVSQGNGIDVVQGVCKGA